MKKYLRIGIIAILAILVTILNISCPKNRDKFGSLPPREHPKGIENSDFIYIDSNLFYLKGEPFFSIMLNYILAYRTLDGKFVISPNIHYDLADTFETNTQVSVNQQLRGHFQLIHEMGFNTLRLCFDRIAVENNRFFYQGDAQKYFVDSDYEQIFSALDTVVNIAKEKDLRIMLLIKSPLFGGGLDSFTVRLLQHFSDNSTIFAYDFFNEPLYFDTTERSKKEIYLQVKQWREWMSQYAQNQLFTVGFSEPIEVFKWDAKILPVDFIAFHTYHPLRVKNEIYWYSTYCGKPWMIGETALPADNDSILYSDQKAFLRDVFRYVKDCGGAGLGWWEFQETVHAHFEANYTGLLNHQGVTHTKDTQYTIFGTVKPVAEEIAAFADYIPQPKTLPVNYYNMLGYNNLRVDGKILDKETHQPIEGAVIRSWTETWIGQNTFANNKGEFTLYSNAKSVHFEISALGYETVKFDDSLNYKSLGDQKYDINNLPDSLLEYHSISYLPFLVATEPHSVFCFDAQKFQKAKFCAQMKTIYLRSLVK
ncbi:MAG: glycoside hydrolase family 5 protein [Bacteroidales bacterium]|jgi:hypothetical protein|nr:glycoside hydrolase family 5 protein [Bacteroidales bacterium]